MATFELNAFQPFRDLSVIGAIESPSTGIVQVGYWVNDPTQRIVWEKPLTNSPRRDFLWEHTTFELFIGVIDDDFYREINFSSSLAWQAYQFEEYRYPENMPPVAAQDIELVDLQRTKFGLTATIDINLFLHQHQLKMQDLFMGIAAVIQTSEQPHFFAMQHSTKQADFHNKRDWLYLP